MPHFKKILATVVLLTLGAAHAKQIGNKATAEPIPTQPQPTRAKTFAQLYNEVKNAQNAWDNKTQLLSNSFVNHLINEAQTAHITKNQLNFLFILARDFHAQFAGSIQDIDILRNLENQRKAINKAF